jgi:uncharacterized protein
MRTPTRFLLLILGLCLVAAMSDSRRSARHKQTSSKATRTAAAIRFPRVIDSAFLLPPGEAARLDDWLRAWREETGTDVRLLFLAHKPPIPLSEYGVRAMRTLGVGEKDGRRGVLVLADKESQQFRIEVGPGLEGVLPDAFISFVLNEHVVPLFRAGDPNLGVRLALFIIRRRIRDAILGEEYDPRPITYIGEPHRLAGGAGAATWAPLDHQYQALTTSYTTDSAVADYFVPQPTPEAAWQRELELLALPHFYPFVTLYTPESQQYMAGLPMSNGFKSYLLYGIFGRKIGVDVRGDLAMIYYTDTPFISPQYLRKGPNGWQLDVIAELRNSLEYGGSDYTWTLRDSGDDFSQRFADRTIKIRSSIYRVRGGDNRRLRTGYWARH